MTKTDLTKILGITPPAVFKIVNKLKERNLLLDNDNTLITSKGGRPRIVLQINKEYMKLVGIFFTPTTVTTSVSHLNGEIIETRIRKRTNSLLQGKLNKLMMEELEYCIEKYGANSIAGIGLAIPGIVNEKRGILVHCPDFDKRDNLKLAEYIESTFNIPCIIENNVRTILKSEKVLGNLKDFNNAFLIYYNNDIGTAILINDNIFHGVNYSSGQLSNTFSNTDIPLGDYCLLSSIIERYNLNENFKFEDIVKHAHDGDEEYINILRDLGDKIGFALSNVIKLLDIDKIVLTGAYFDNNNILMEAIKNKISENVENHVLNITLSSFNKKIEANASISLVMSNLFSGRQIIK